MASLSAWLFDVYPDGEGMRLWLLDADGRMHSLQDTFTPCLYVRGPLEDLRAVARMLRLRQAPVAFRRTERRDLFLDRQIEVLEIDVRLPALLPTVLRWAAEFRPGLTYYDADIPLPQRYVLARGLFPLAACDVDYDASTSRVRDIATVDTPWEVDYRLPPFKVMTLRLGEDRGDDEAGELYNPARRPKPSQPSAANAGPQFPVSSFQSPIGDHESRTTNHKPPNTKPSPQGGKRARDELLVEVDGREYAFSRRRSRHLVLGLRHLLERHDPDLIVSAYGDSYLLPRLLELSDHYGIPLPLNRDAAQSVAHKKAHSYFSYGRIVFRDEQHLLFGRWHIDRQNAFLADDYGLDGTLEIARLTGLPVQTVARVSTGTGISAMQVATAWRRGVLIPWQKRQPESLKTGVDLLVADKGGLVYTPTPGLHQHVAELDFTAMYPSIMVNFNISPETVGRHCSAGEGTDEAASCEGVPVPELGTPVCRHRQGIVPETLAPLLEKRARYKALVRSLPDTDPRKEAFRRRYSAHKWLLVTCFGYLGYKNARFGRIEAHEAVTAYGREVLLRAKEIVEQRGFRVLHLYVDGLWVDRPGSSQSPDYDSLLAEIQAQTGLHVALEGIYRWLAFLPSRVEPRLTVANRYFGAFEDGRIKVRGIEARRHDTPTFIKDTQLGALEILAQAPDAAGFRRDVPQAVAYLRQRLAQLRAGQVPLHELIVGHNLSRQPNEFTVRTPAARVAAEFTRAGIQLSPGERLRFIYVSGPEKARAWDLLETPIAYDREVYTTLFLRAVESLLASAGVDAAMLETWLLGDSGYWGPPGALPPAGIDGRWPLLARAGILRPRAPQPRPSRLPAVYRADLLPVPQPVE
ncbi:MAG TPA: DNA polymerase domain-containing protein [Anaerolineales bacterium]|nr:DNA polymerase domain-containing protein [Anaerolineales bacterium]